MATESERLTGIERRQVDTNMLLNEILSVMEVISASQQTMAERLVDLETWLQTPPKTDLPDLLRRVASALEDLPAAVVRALDKRDADRRV